MVTVAIDIETWISGTLIGGHRVYGDSAEEVRKSKCPKMDGWDHCIDENTVAAKKGSTMYLFVVAQE